MTFILGGPCPVTGCNRMHGVTTLSSHHITRPGTRSGFAGSGGAIEPRPGSVNPSPVGASAPESQFPPSGLPTTG